MQTNYNDALKLSNHTEEGDMENKTGCSHASILRLGKFYEIDKPENAQAGKEVYKYLQTNYSGSRRC